MKRKKKRILLLCVTVLLCCVLGYSLYRYFSARQVYDEEEENHQALLAYRPTLPPELAEEETHGAEASEPSEVEAFAGRRPAIIKSPNMSIRLLQEQYPDTVGWITVPGTMVDYPIMQAEDNDYYLHRRQDGSHLYAGIPFMDYRNDPYCRDKNTIIYGHHMKNGTMFGTLVYFKDKEFFDSHDCFYVFLPDCTIRAKVVACLVVEVNQASYAYEIEPGPDYLSQLKTDARRIRDFTPGENDRYITLSTCDYEFENCRVLIVGLVQDD